MADDKKTALMKIEFSPDQVALIKSTVAPGATDDELKLFLYQAQRTGLDPLARQLYFLKRKYQSNGVWKEKVSIQTSIDGFRVVAERNGFYAGQSEPEFEETGTAFPKVCKVKVFRFAPDGQRYEASVGVAYWAEYCPGNEKESFMWRKMPHTMLAKVAEALALRKAFPQDLSGLYTDEEMEQANQGPKSAEVVPPDVEAPKITKGKKVATKKAKEKQEVVEGEIIEKEKKEAEKTVEQISGENPIANGPVVDSPGRQAKLKWVKALVEQNKLPMADYENYTDAQLVDVMSDYRKSIGK